MFDVCEKCANQLFLNRMAVLHFCLTAVQNSIGTANANKISPLIKNMGVPKD